MRPLRILQILFLASGILGTLALLPIAVRRWEVAGAQVLILPIMVVLFTALPVGMIELQFRSLRKKGLRVRQAIDGIAPGSV